MADEDIQVTMAKLVGMIEKLDAKLDSKIDLVAQKIDAGDRESQQAVRFLQNDVSHLSKSLDTTGARITNVATECQSCHQVAMAEIDSLKSWRATSKGAIALIMVLWPFVSALILKAIDFGK